MRIPIRNYIFIFLLFFLPLNIPSDTRAQSEIYFSNVAIALWPEFDSPEMLVIYYIQLAEDIFLPVELTLRIPASVGELHALADSVVGDISYTREVEGLWAKIYFTANSNVIQLEYYDASLNVEDAQRQYEFNWPVDYPISAFRVDIKLPEDVRSVLLPSAYSGPTSGEDGYIYYEIVGSNMRAGEELRVSLKYTRGADTQQLLAWGLGIVGAALIVMGGYRYIKTSGSSKLSRTRRKLSGVKPESAIFCHNCGTKAKHNDKFCRNCGTQLRSR